MKAGKDKKYKGSIKEAGKRMARLYWHKLRDSRMNKNGKVKWRKLMVKRKRKGKNKYEWNEEWRKESKW